MNWTDIRPVIKTLIGDLSGLETTWEDEPRSFGDTFVTLKITAVATHGNDENRIKQDLTKPTGQEMQDVWCGNRTLTLTVKAESLIQTDGGSAYAYLEQVRDRLVFRASGDALRAVNVAIIGPGTTVDLTGVRDDRTRSIAALDVFLAARNVTYDPTLYPFIETWDMTGTLLKP